MIAEADGMMPTTGRCNECVVLWPDVEAIDIYCVEDPGHDPNVVPHRASGWVWVDGLDDVRVEEESQ